MFVIIKSLYCNQKNSKLDLQITSFGKISDAFKNFEYGDQVLTCCCVIHVDNIFTIAIVLKAPLNDYIIVQHC